MIAPAVPRRRTRESAASIGSARCWPLIGTHGNRPAATQQGPEPLSPGAMVQLGAAQAALREALETPAQTAKEAGTGDLQAKRLLAKEAAAKAESAPSKHVVA